MEYNSIGAYKKLYKGTGHIYSVNNKIFCKLQNESNNEEHIKVVEKAVKNAAENGINMRDEILQELNLKKGFSNRTLRRFLQKKTMLTRGFANSLQSKQIKKS